MSIYWKLIRPGIVGMVLFSMAVAAWTAGERPPSWPVLLHALLGTALVIVGAVALNQRLEFRGDAKMPRTAGRPLPAGRLSEQHVARFGLLISAVGAAYLAVWSGLSLLLLATASWALYVWAYTPLKSRSTWQTPVGALAGAMPMLLGAAAADALCTATALALFGVLFCWQLPHSMAIAWLYRHEFASADVKLATVVDPSGRTAGLVAVAGSVVLMPVSLIPSLIGHAGWPYGLVALLLGHAYMACSLNFLRRREEANARWLLRASLVYLPLLFAALLCFRSPYIF